MPRSKEHKVPKIGTAFDLKRRNKAYQMRVVRKDGKVAFEVEGQVFATPSAAAKSITRQEVNGWRFWHME